MKSSVCLPETHMLFQLKISMISLCLGKLKFLNHAKVSNAFEVLRLEIERIDTQSHTRR